MPRPLPEITSITGETRPAHHAPGIFLCTPLGERANDEGSAFTNQFDIRGHNAFDERRRVLSEVR